MKYIFLFLAFVCSAQAQIQTKNIDIVRDKWGVPHIFGKTDAEVAYGLAWAHSEDDFKTIQLTILASKGMLGKLKGKDGAAVDYVARLLRTQEIAAEKMHTLSPAFVAVAKGYLAGLNKYALLNQKEVLIKGSFPVTMEDYVSGLILSLSVISGVDGVLKDIFNGTIENPKPQEEVKGSNAFAIATHKTTTGEAFLNINSHQPLEGPVAWYEAHLNSEQGWNMIGGLFPAGCVIFHGTNEHLGWAHTVNHQDKIDVFKLEMKEPKSNQYKFDNEWLSLEEKKVKLKVKMGPFTLPISKKVYWSVYGATIKTETGVYAVRFGANQDIRGVEQWYRMNKATNFKEFYSAMEMTAIPGFHTIYADNDENIFHVSNGKIPLRNPSYKWSGVVPGNTSSTLWNEFHPFKDLPQYLNPKAGYLFNTNNSVFNATGRTENLKPADFDLTMGYPNKDNNRSTRFMELIANYDKLNYQDFKKIKYDGYYPKDLHFPLDINTIWAMSPNDFPAIAEELSLLQNWDRNSNIESTGAGLFSALVYKLAEYHNQDVLSEELAFDLIKKTKAELISKFGTSAVPLAQVQHLVRGEKELPIAGLPDVITAMYTQPHRDGIRKGVAGESYIQLVRFRKGKLPKIESIINYGAANHKDSPHFADQMELFTQQKTKPMTLDKKEVYAKAKRIYSPD